MTAYLLYAGCWLVLACTRTRRRESRWESFPKFKTYTRTL